MKNFWFNLLAICAFALLAQALQAQPSGGIWMGSRSANPNANAVHAVINGAYEAFSDGNYEKGWAAFTEEAAEIGPDGKTTFGKNDLQEATGVTTVCNPCNIDINLTKDKTQPVPKNSFKINPKGIMVRMLTNDIALAVWDLDFDCGAQKSGHLKVMAVLHKIKGSWKIEFNLVTEIGMPALDATRGN